MGPGPEDSQGTTGPPSPTLQSSYNNPSHSPCEEASTAFPAALPAAPLSSLIPFCDLYPLPLLTWPGLPSVRSSQKSERARQPLQVAVKVPARSQSSSDHLDHEME